MDRGPFLCAFRSKAGEGKSLTPLTTGFRAGQSGRFSAGESGVFRFPSAGLTCLPESGEAVVNGSGTRGDAGAGVGFNGSGGGRHADGLGLGKLPADLPGLLWPYFAGGGSQRGKNGGELHPLAFAARGEACTGGNFVCTVAIFAFKGVQ